ncbi:glycosyltransferase family 2 protein [Thomasclavelia cocleata]|jgi:GT2 family glycosyltransferase|uniref:glycosyltransferase family 2 protein n=1 Tax=Thomasclavelia cocleata TaxID=69824 RepID=UPI0024327974|nr:glycosyltransferase family 2 protein [Thomasclavelia cocleata]MCI9630308.1 glycosyltransferase family 2 protein [Thomasclavelia cocleata]
MIGIVILNYLTYNETIKCVDSIKKTGYRDKKIVIVDNASQNDSFKFLYDTYKNDSEVILVNNTTNNGYAAGNNVGIKLLPNNCEYLIISNSDIIFKRDSLKKLIEPLEKKEANCVAPKVLKFDGTEWFSNQFVPIGKKELVLGYSFLKRLDLKKTYKLVSGLNKDRNKKAYIYAPSGCCFAIKITDFKKIGFFDEKTFLGYEEAILGNKLRKNNMNVLYYPDAQIYHMHMASTKQIGGLSMVYCSQSELYYVKNYLNASKNYICFLSLIRIIEYIRLVLKNRDNIKWLSQYIKVFKDAIIDSSN